MAAMPFATYKSMNPAEPAAVRDVHAFHACLTGVLNNLHGKDLPSKVEIVESVIYQEPSLTGKVVNDYKYTYKRTEKLEKPRVSLFRKYS